jgi:hypothetical protein
VCMYRRVRPVTSLRLVRCYRGVTITDVLRKVMAPGAPGPAGSGAARGGSGVARVRGVRPFGRALRRGSMRRKRCSERASDCDLSAAPFVERARGGSGVASVRASATFRPYRACERMAPLGAHREAAASPSSARGEARLSVPRRAAATSRPSAAHLRGRGRAGRPMR